MTLIKEAIMGKSRRMGRAWAGALLWLLSAMPSDACTLWGAAGDAVLGGGTLVAKNRDWAPDHRQELVVLSPPEGYRSVALMAVGNDEPGIKAGVNEKGLVIVSATANQIASAERKNVHQKQGLMRHYLATCASVEDVLKSIDLLRRPVFYLVADRKEVAIVEIGRDGRRAVTRKDSGTLLHTNHYCFLQPQGLGSPGASSQQRYARIDELLKLHGKAFVLDDFIRFSEDRNAGPDNSIWRTGSDPRKRRTLATWLVSIPASGSPLLYLKTADPGEPERVCRLAVEEALRLKEGDRIPLSASLCSGPALSAFFGSDK
jgi:hypothetical protein